MSRDVSLHGPGEGLPFLKMHGAGNDFVVVDARRPGVDVPQSLAQMLGDRHRGVGFDQLVVIHPSDRAAARLVFLNADGSTAGACGNATRCVARLLMDEAGTEALELETERGLLPARRAGGRVSVNLGQPQLHWRDVPLAEDIDLLHLPLPGGPVAVGMGNPHAVHFVEDAEAVDLETEGPGVETHALFPLRTNVEYVSVLGPDRLRMRVWERGAGVTLACGSGACAVAVAAHRRGLTGRRVEIVADGGLLSVDYAEDGVWLTGPTALVFAGRLSSEMLAQA